MPCLSCTLPTLHLVSVVFGTASLENVSYTVHFILNMGKLFTKIWKDTIDLLVKGTAHTRMKVIGGKSTVKLNTSVISDIGHLTKSLKR